MTEISLEQVYSIVDSFFKRFEGNFLVEYFKKNYYGKRGFGCRLSPRDIISLNLYRFFMQISHLKAFHCFVNAILAKNREKCRAERVHFADSTPVEVCKNNKISRNRVDKGYASRGKSTKGWFYGFKLHGVCAEDMTVESLVFTTGSVHDSKMAFQLTKNIAGKAFADGGYQLKARSHFKTGGKRCFYAQHHKKEYEPPYLRRTVPQPRKTQHNRNCMERS